MKKSNSEMNRLLEEHHKMLKSWAKRFVTKGLGEYEDMLQEAYMVFLNVFDKYDESKGVKFSTYLYQSLKYYMYNEIKKAYNKPQVVSLDRPVDMETTFLDNVQDDRYEIESDLLKLLYIGYSQNAISKLSETDRRKVKKAVEDERKKEQGLYKTK